MLPDFPKARKKVEDVWWQEIFRFRRLDPILAQIPVRAQREGKQSSYQRQEGEIKEIDYKLLSYSHVTLPRDKGFPILDYLVEAAKIGHGIAQESVKFLLQQLDQITHEAGTFIDVKGEKFEAKHLLAAWEKMEFSFDEHGRPLFPMMTGGSAMAERMKQVLADAVKDEAFLAQCEELFRKKREKFLEREARRRLVD